MQTTVSHRPRRLGTDGRAARKRWQVESVHAAVWRLAGALGRGRPEGAGALTIVDFGSGSGSASRQEGGGVI